MNIKKDMHIHSCFSDGDLRPETIVDRWESAGHKLIAITDHDGIEGSIIACKYAETKSINVIPGIEFDSEDDLGKDLHILGYHIDFDNPRLQSALFELKRWRAQRNDEMLEILSDLGYEISIDDLIAVNDGNYIGKPTFARVLIDKGYVKDLNEAFNEVFDKEPRLNSVTKKTLRSHEVIEIIHAAGGTAVLAHPIQQKRKGETDEEFFPRLVQLLDLFRLYGIDGIECEHPSASAEEALALKNYAEKYKLTVTCGSDFHSDKMKRKY